MDSLNYFDKLDALAIMALHYSNNQSQTIDFNEEEITWSELFVFIVTKCFITQRMDAHTEQRIAETLKDLYNENDVTAELNLYVLTVMGHLEQPAEQQVKRIMSAFKIISERLTVSEFIIQHQSTMSHLLFWICRFISNIRLRLPKPYEIPLKFRIAFGICYDYGKMIRMYRYGLVDSPVDVQSYRYIVQYIMWRTNLDERIIHHYLAQEEYTMFD